MFRPVTRLYLVFSSLILLLGVSASSAAPAPNAQDPVAALKSLSGATPTQRQAVYKLLGEHGDATLIPALKAYRDGLLLLRNNQLMLYGPRTDVAGRGSVLPLLDAISGQPILGPDHQPIYADKPDLTDAIKSPPYRERRILAGLIESLSLNDPDPDARREAIRSAGDRGATTLLPALQAQLAANPTSPFAPDLKEAIARIQLANGTADEKRAAADTLADDHTSRALSSMTAADADPANRSDPQLMATLNRGIAAANRYQSEISFIQNTFAGLSTGSILVLLALGLSIIFGLMGVINMAQGEFMMVGAFTTLVVSNFFASHWPGAYGWYPVVAIPAAFLVAGAVGWLCEALVIRHLYGRPLETLLATWGVGLILIQTARVIFGNNESVRPPHWMEGGVEVAPDLVFPLNRLYIILFCGICIALVYLVVNKTKLGLLLRATTQNREMAAALGVATRRVDALTFAFGTGLAGLAGVAVPLYNKINPSIGQEYIVDSFMVVVVGGVGKLAGAIVAGLGLGFLTKYLEPLLGMVPAFASGASVVGRVIVLGLIVLFLQWRPSGLFPPRGRLADS